MDDLNQLPWWAEMLARPPIRIKDDTSEEELSHQLAERLEALLESRNGLTPTPDGWRDLALALALEYVPAFQIETPADRTGRSGRMGRPVGFKTFALRSRMNQEMQSGLSQAQAAKKIERLSKGGTKAKTAQNAMSRSANPDLLKRLRYESAASRAALAAARKLSRQC